MRRRLKLRVSDAFAAKLERIARSTGRPMAAVLESLVTPVLEAAQADARFEADALAAWEAYQLTGVFEPARALDAAFARARLRARAVRADRWR